MAKPINLERRNQIVQYVLAKGSVTVSELAKNFDVSMVTMRKDLDYLTSNNLLEKGHGIVNIAKSYTENSFSLKEEKNLKAKTLIAKKAAGLIRENNVVFLDSGSTTLQLAKILSVRDDIIIVSNSAIIGANLYNASCQILITGGELRKKSLSYVGPWTHMAIEQIKIDIAFLSCSGFQEKGPSIDSFRELSIKQDIIKKADTNILLADTSKFQRRSLYRYADFYNFSAFVTERALHDEELEKYADLKSITIC
ncbi:DeoR/GlpR family DNA-binding transcription regulator [Pectinatus haikarae]|uniref:DeoR/GlpR family DNA-binding transcription regulator n=1 Tax=Pectinatus haikarae TaxID=349096 RepID=UPI0018C52F4B|nr:DeoR/GlpR family DNA-binding transcription regulator [Pectinatus haikarae]